VPDRLHGYALRAFDQGFGRCLWFVEGTDARRIAQTIAGFPPERRGDLWSGVGLASVYAGEVGETELQLLRDSARPFIPQLAQGVAFAAKARQRAGNLKPYHDLACGVLCSSAQPRPRRFPTMRWRTSRPMERSLPTKSGGSGFNKGFFLSTEMVR